MPSIKIEGSESTMKSSNGRGSLRPSGRSPPFLLIGLSVALCIIGFNYWSVSSRNSELLGQISILKREVQNQATMRITADKRAEEVGSRANKYLEEKTKCMTDRRLIQDNADECVESSKACEADRTGLNERLQQVESELKEQQVKNIQSEKKCDLNSCLQPIGNIINILTNSIGKDAVRNPLIQNGIDVTALFKDLVGSNSMQGNLEKNKQYGLQEDLNQTKLNFMPNKQQAEQEPGQEQQGQQQGSQGLQPGQQQGSQGQQAGQQQGSQGLQPGQQQGSQGQQPGQQQGSQGQQPGAQEQQGQQPGAQEQQGQQAGQLQGSQGQQPGQQQGSQGLQPGQQVQQGQQAEQQQGSQLQQQGGQGQEPGQQQGSHGLQPGQQQGSQGLQPGQQVQQGQQAGQEQQGQQAGQEQQGQQQGSQGLHPGQQQGSQGLQPGQQQGSQGLQPGQQEQQGQQAGQEQQGQQAGQQQGSQGLQPGQQEQQGQQAEQEQQGQEPGQQQGSQGQQPNQQQASQKQEPGQNQQQPLQGQEAGKLLQDLKQQIGKVSGQLNAGQQQPGQEQGQQQQGQELGQQQPGQEPGQQKAVQETGSQKLEQPLPGLPYNLPNVNSNKTASGDVKVKNEESPIQSKTELANEQVKTTPKPEQNLEVKNQINKPEPKDNTDKQVPDQFVFQNLDKPQPNFNSENKIGFAPPHQILKPVDQKTDKDYSYDMKDDEPGKEAKDQKEQPNVVIEENSIDKLKKQLEEQEH